VLRITHLIIALTTALSLQAQDSTRWDIGIITGLQRSYYDNQEGSSLGYVFTPKNELVNGFMVNYDINPYLLVEANILHSKKEFEFSSPSSTLEPVKTKHSYLGFPFLLKSGFGKKIKVSIISGLTYEVALGHSLETESGLSKGDLRDSENYASVTEIQVVPRSNQLFVNAGLGLRLPIEDYFHFYTSTRYSKSLTPVYSNGAGTYQHLIFLFGLTANI